MAVIRPTLPSLAFTMVPNAWLRDPDLKPAPKAYLAYLLSHEAGFRCSTALAARDMGVGRDTVSGWNAHLIERGYFVAVKQSRRAGRWAENDYTITDCTACRPPLPTVSEDPALFEPADAGKPTVSGKPRTEEPRTGMSPLRRTPREDPPPPGVGARALRAVDADAQADADLASTAQGIACEHYEGTGKLGGSKAFLAVRGIVTAALTAGHPPEQIRPALALLRSRGRPVTNSTLGPLLADPRLTAAPSGNGRSPYRDPDPAAYSQPF